MLVYDKAHELAKEIQQSGEYKEYARLKEKVMENDQTKGLLKDYKKLQFEAEASYLAGSEPSEELKDKIKKLSDVLAFSHEVADYFAAEYKFQTLVRDVYGIIGAACDLGLDFLKE